MCEQGKIQFRSGSGRACDQEGKVWYLQTLVLDFSEVDFRGSFKKGLILFLLLLSCFSHVQLCATP